MFDKVEVKKSLALHQVTFWDEKEKLRALMVEEVKARKEAREDLKKWVFLEEIS